MGTQIDMLPTIERIKVKKEVIARYTTESEFVGLAVELLKEVASYTGIAACAWPKPDLGSGTCDYRGEHGSVVETVVRIPGPNVPKT